MMEEIGIAWAIKQRQQVTPVDSLGIKEKSCGRFLGNKIKVSKLARLHQDWSQSEVLVPCSDPWQASSRDLVRDEAGDGAKNCKDKRKVELELEGEIQTRYNLNVSYYMEDLDFKEDDTKEAVQVFPNYLGKVRHKCSQCNFETGQKSRLTSHMKSHSNVRPFLCNVCERGFKTDRERKYHEHRHYKLRPCKCSSCEAAFTTPGELARHEKYKHTGKKSHHCTECDYSCVELAKLNRHKRVHTGERPFQCPHCSYSAAVNSNLKRHIRVHTGERPYVCDVCDAAFTQRSSMKEHKKEQHIDGNPVFQCTVCFATCKRKKDVRVHMTRFHSSDHEMICSKYDLRFPDQASLKVPKPSPQKEKLYKCDLCQYACSTHKRLEEHMLTHVDSKPMNCDEFNESFRTKPLSEQHQNLYHNFSCTAPSKSHKCTECYPSFAHKFNLVKQQANHIPKLVRAQVSFRRDQQTEVILEKSEFLKHKVNLNIPVKNRPIVKKCHGCSVETSSVCKSCKEIVRFGVRRTLKQRGKERKCQEGDLKSKEQDTCAVANLGERKRSSSEISDKKLQEFFQQLKKPLVENKENRGEVIKSFQYMKTLKVNKSPDHMIKSFLIESGGERSVELVLQEVIHMMEKKDVSSWPPLYSPLVTLLG